MKLYSGIIELKPNWFVRLPCPMTWLEMSRYRFDPISPWLVPLLIAGGAGVSGYGMYQQGAAAKAQGETEAAIAEYNAKILEQEAVERRKAAEYQAQVQEREGERLLGTQKALYGMSGVDFSGTPLSVIEETATELEMDRQMLLREGYTAAGRSGSQAAISRMQGTAAKARGTAAYRGGVLSAGGTILTGLGTAAYYGSMAGGGLGGTTEKTETIKKRPETTKKTGTPASRLASTSAATSLRISPRR